MIEFLIRQFKEPKLILKYIVSGSIAAGAQLGILVLLVEVYKFEELVAVPIAFTLSAFVAFGFQKFWTFRDSSFSHSHFQMGLYLILAGIALSLNIFFMFLFVKVFHFWYIFGQILTIGIVTTITFLCNKNIVFNRGFIIPHVPDKD